MSRVARNAMALLLSQSATWVSGIAVLLVAPSQLGEADFGRMNFAIVFVSFFQLFAMFGTGDYLTKTVARQPDAAGSYVTSTLMLKLIASIGLGLLAVGVGFAFRFDDEMMLLIGIFALGLVLNTLHNVLMGGLQGLQLMGLPALWGVIRLYLGAALGLFALYQGGGVVAFSLVTTVVGVIPIVANTWQLRGVLRRQRWLDRGVWRDVIRGGVPFFVLAALLTVYGSIDIPMIQAFSDSETVGWYSLAYRWVSMPALFAVAIATAAFPALSAEGVELTDAFRSLANRALHVVAFASIPAAVGITLIADDFVAALYDEGYAPSGPLMQVLALHIPVVAFDIVLGTVAVSSDRQREWMVYAGLASIFNPLTNLIAIPLTMRWFDNGAIGAAFTTVLTELILMWGAYRLRPPGVFDRATGAVVLRVVVASSMMIPVVLVLSPLPLLVRIGAAVVTYALATIVLRTLPAAELRRLVGRPSSNAIQSDDAVTPS